MMQMRPISAREKMTKTWATCKREQNDKKNDYSKVIKIIKDVKKYNQNKIQIVLKKCTA